MLLCDSYQLPGITLPFPVREWTEHQTTFAMLEEQKFALVQSLASLAHWMGIRAAIQSTVITSTEQRAHMQVSSSDHCERAILSTVSISQRVKSMKSVSFAILRKLEFGRHLRPCVGMSFSCWCCCVKASRTSAFIRNQVACSDSEQEWAEHWTTFAMLKENKHLWSLVLVQCFASLANWWGLHAAIQFISNTSTADRHMQWPLWENHSLPSFHYCQGPDQWRVSASRCRKLRTLDLGRHLRPCVKMCQEDFLVADAVVWRLPAILLPYSIRSKNEQIIEQLLLSVALLEGQTLALV